MASLPRVPAGLFHCRATRWLLQMSWSLVALLLVAVSWLPRATAQADPGPLQQARVDFVVANTVFALSHEFGHAVIRDFDLPLLGLEEDSADTLAAMFMLGEVDHSASPENHRRLTGMLALAALGNVLTWKTGLERQDSEVFYWAQHGLSVRRAARIACLIYGSDQQRYSWIVELAKMPEFRRDICEDEFGIARRATSWVRDTYGVRQGRLRNKAAVEIGVEYGRTFTGEQATVRAFLQQERILERLSGRVDDMLDFGAPLTVRDRTCGGPNAYWDPEGRELRLCYELLEAFWKLSADPDLEGVYATIRGKLGS
ncbi:MAG: hypothetical protein IT486_05680 [Gammaproteobacteria bacterium]|nr:hypothetical protein [Gammaproteobacteria bacterium]